MNVCERPNEQLEMMHARKWNGGPIVRVFPSSATLASAVAHRGVHESVGVSVGSTSCEESENLSSHILKCFNV